MKKLGLYVHFPFCIKKCYYCDFLSFENNNEEILRTYCNALIKEIEKWGPDLNGYIIDTLFFGGGTPSLIPEEALEKVIAAIYKNFKIKDDIEFTIESNPKTLNKDKLASYLSSGINRISMGVQTLDVTLLNFIGRVHSAQDFYKNYYEAREAGFNNINTDLIFAVPTQEIKIWQDTLEEILRLKPEHVSFYSLKYEEGTPFYNRFCSGEWTENEEEDRNMYWYAVNQVKQKGYIHYEISNAAVSGFECRHNLKYWSMDEYLGIGLGAHSFLGEVRFSNERNLNKYIQNANNMEDIRTWSYQNRNEDDISEYIFTGLRKREGISLSEFEERFNMPIEHFFSKEIEELLLGKWIKIKENQMMLTRKGVDISNTIMSKFIIL